MSQRRKANESVDDEMMCDDDNAKFERNYSPKQPFIKILRKIKGKEASQ